MADSEQARKRKRSDLNTPRDPFSEIPPLAILDGFAYTPKLAQLPSPREDPQPPLMASSLFNVTSDTPLLTFPERGCRSPFNPEEQEHIVSASRIDNSIAERLIVPEIHPLLAAKLKQHQLDGVRFMWKQVVGFMHGCIIAHTMGLGKTLQVITFVTLLACEIAKQNPVIPHFLTPKRVLVLAPLTTISNWMNEFDKWVPQELMQRVGHTYNFSDAMSAGFSFSYTKRTQYLREWYRGGGVLLMGYEQYRILLTKDTPHHNEIRTYLQDPGPSLVIADEGHRLKNHASRLAIAVSQIRTPARICLTGSPVQNNLDEFYCLVNLVAPTLLPEPDLFARMYRLPIENIFTESNASDIYIAKKQLLKLKLMTSSVIQRRGPEYLSDDLPPKKEYYVACRLTDVQLRGYDIMIDHFRTSSQSVLITHIALRGLCNHPAILQKILLDRNARTGDPSRTDTVDMDTLVEDELVDFSEFATKMLLNCLSSYFDNIPIIEDPRHSSKMVAIMGIAERCKAAGEKVIIVSHSILCLDFLEKLLGSRNYGISRIDGNTNQPQRQGIIDLFNVSLEKDIMLLSAQAGSLGVNITGASRIILCDSDWNPVHDEQSIGRIYRYGQQKPVFVYRMFQYSTIEDVLMSRKLHKRGLASRVVDNQYFKKQNANTIRKYHANPVETDKAPEECDDPVLNSIIQAEPRLLVAINHPLDMEVEDVVTERDLSPEDVEQAKREALGMKKAYLSRHLPRAALV